MACALPTVAGRPTPRPGSCSACMLIVRVPMRTCFVPDVATAPRGSLCCLASDVLKSVPRAQSACARGARPPFRGSCSYIYIPTYIHCCWLADPVAALPLFCSYRCSEETIALGACCVMQATLLRAPYSLVLVYPNALDSPLDLCIPTLLRVCADRSAFAVRHGTCAYALHFAQAGWPAHWFLYMPITACARTDEHMLI